MLNDENNVSPEEELQVIEALHKFKTEIA